MILVALLIGVILVVASIRGSQGALFSALATDVPAFVTWAAAIIALGAIGWVPGLKPISRGLLTLVIVVILLRDYQPIIAGFQKAIASATPKATAASTGTNSAAPASGASAPAASAAPAVPSATAQASNLALSFAPDVADVANAFASGGF